MKIKKKLMLLYLRKLQMVFCIAKFQCRYIIESLVIWASVAVLYNLDYRGGRVSWYR